MPTETHLQTTSNLRQLSRGQWVEVRHTPKNWQTRIKLVVQYLLFALTLLLVGDGAMKTFQD